MGFLEELASRSCERFTSRSGCLDGHTPIEEQCPPCRARAELGLSAEAPRHCESCGAHLVAVDISGGIPTGIDEAGSHHCPAPLHRPKLFYDEFTTIREERDLVRKARLAETPEPSR